ncbi:acyltransferase family protein [Zhongshania guokunii]|uniref:Acyltransferase family protein n=1 Tax=Zhongshania guokunii TaxID=641783 RepID=A0ABV3U911_9GAMM
MHYRADIDGLRALAVVPVILYHAGVGVFSGGYIGVDVFFVISGYLITHMILSDMDEGSFSLSDFYERRARRILPALFLVVFACLLPAWYWLVPIDMSSFAESLIAVPSFLSNIQFWLESGYFERSAELKPLLHTWSLGVEEQYYLLFPLLILGCWRFGKRRLNFMLIALAAVSLLLSRWAAHKAPEANFYLLPTRAWEIFSGAFIAFYYSRGGVLKVSWRVRQSLGVFGLFMLLLGVFIYDRDTRYPGFYALLPVLGTVLIILFSAPNTLVYGLLSSRLFVGMGLLSYGAYLWHQPLFAFARYYYIFQGEPPALLMALLVLLCIVLAYLSRRYIEEPFRNRAKVSSPVFRRAAVSAALVLMGAGALGVADKGNVFRFDPDLLTTIEAARNSRSPAAELCRTDAGEEFYIPQAECWYGSGQKKVLVWGDSHVDNTAAQLADYLPQAKIYHAGYASCPPIKGIHRVDIDYSDCAAYTDTVWQWAKTEGFDAIVLSARWRIFAEASKFDNGEGGVEDFVVNFVPDGQYGNEAERRAGVLAAYKASIAALADEFANVPIFLVYQIPEAGSDVPDLYLRAATRAHEPLLLSTDYGVYKAANRRTNEALGSIDKANIQRIRPDEVFCNAAIAGRCVVAQGDSLFYLDDDHPSYDGAALLAKYFAELIGPSL